MDTAVTVIQVVLALLFGISGLLKLTQPHAKYVKLPAQSWATDFSSGNVHLIGILELSAAIGILVPLLLPSLTLLVPLAAVGLALLMSGAMATHLRRAEYVNMIGNLVWLGVALFVAYGTLVGFAA